MKHRRSTAVAALALLLGASGCTSDGGGAESDGERSPSETATSATTESVADAADDAAAAYVRDLQSYQRQLDRAATRTAAASKANSAPQWRAADRLFTQALSSAPTLAEVEGGAEDSASYARAVEVAERAQGFVDEHEWMTGWDLAANVDVHRVLQQKGIDEFTVSQVDLADFERTVAGPGNFFVKLQRALTLTVANQLKRAKASRPEIDAIAGKDSFTPSLRDHLMYELDDRIAVGERFLEYAKTIPPKAAGRDMFRNAFFNGKAAPAGAIANAPADRLVLMRELLATGVGKLVTSANRDQGELPRAGDIYRQLITGLYVRPTSSNDAELTQALTEQLYWLWRLREIEGTPDEAFQDARLTIKLQYPAPVTRAKMAVDSKFDELAALSAELAVAISNPETYIANKPWIIELLARPFPRVLDEPVTMAREAAELLPDDASTPISPELQAMGKPLLASLTKAAERLDDPKRFRKALEASIERTRPTDS